MKNLAVIVDSLSVGGAERVAGLLSLFLQNYYNVFVLVTKMDNITYEHGGQIKWLYEATGGQKTTIEYALAIMKEKYNIHVSISFTEAMNFANIRSKKNERVIISERSTYAAKTPRIEAMDYNIKTHYNYADAIVACSYGVKQSLIDQYGICENRVSMIPNFINAERIQNLSYEKRDRNFNEFIEGSQYFINIGRLEDVKQHATLIKLFSEYRKNQAADVKLVILGSGSLESELFRLIQNEEMTDSIRIFPYTSNPFPYLANALGLILSSKYEGMPNVILEAFALGVPVISVDCMSGPRELLADERDYSVDFSYPMITRRGILISSDIGAVNQNRKGFIQAMEWMLDHQYERKKMGLNALQFIKDYSKQDIINRWINVIEDENGATESYRNSEEKLLEEAESIYIYGAGVLGERVYNTYSPRYHITAFIQSRIDENKKEAFGIPIITPREVAEKGSEVLILIGVSERYMNEVMQTIRENGLNNVMFPF